MRTFANDLPQSLACDVWAEGPPSLSNCLTRGVYKFQNQRCERSQTQIFENGGELRGCSRLRCHPRKHGSSALCYPASTMRRKWWQVERYSYCWLAVCPRRNSERLQRFFINRYPQLHFVLASVEPRMPIEFINKFFT
jgi:hypothetical protein